MRWHPASGIGIVALANARYARVQPAALEALVALVAADAARSRKPVLWPATQAARSAVERLLDAWDDDLAAGLFAMNVALDEDLAARRAAIERLREVHGSLRPDPDVPATSLSPAHLSWWLRGDRGRVEVEILLNPERPPRVQTLTITSVPQPPDALAAIVESVVTALNGPDPRWPAGRTLADSVDRDQLERDLRASAAIYGPFVLDRPIAGDGTTAATWRLAGDRGSLTLTLELDGPYGALKRVALAPVTLEPPVHAF